MSASRAIERMAWVGCLAAEYWASGGYATQEQAMAAARKFVHEAEHRALYGRAS